MNPDEWEHRLPILHLKKSQSGVIIVMFSGYRFGYPNREPLCDNQMGLDRNAVLFS
jgi:hypothetical protein